MNRNRQVRSSGGKKQRWLLEVRNYWRKFIASCGDESGEPQAEAPQTQNNQSGEAAEPQDQQ